MYDWIPYEFDFWYRWDDMSYETYHCIANDAKKSTFQVFKEGTGLVNRAYETSDLLEAMKHGSQINGMTMRELKDAYYCEAEESDVDISVLI